MPGTFSQILLHRVFSTKHRQPGITADLQSRRRLGLTAPGASLLLGIGALSGMLVGVLAHAGHIGAGALWWVVGGVLVVVFTLSRVPVYGPRHSVSSQVGAPLRVRNG